MLHVTRRKELSTFLVNFKQSAAPCCTFKVPLCPFCRLTSDHISLFIWQVNKFGDSALHAAARARQLPACVHLLTLGARKLTRNKNGRDAEGDARDLGFNELADWLVNTRLG